MATYLVEITGVIEVEAESIDDAEENGMSLSLVETFSRRILEIHLCNVLSADGEE